MEAALSWFQLPQQDADNIEEKPKVHLETEVQEGGGAGGLRWGLIGTKNPKSLRHRAVQWMDALAIALELVGGRPGSHVPPPPSAPASRLGGGASPALSTSHGLRWHSC